MRTSLRRAFAIASATVVAAAALVVGAAAPAAAADSTSCPHDSSRRLLTGDGGWYKLWLYQPDAGTVYLCFGEYLDARGVLVIRSGGAGLVPTVTPTLNDCQSFFHLQEPADVDIRLMVDAFPVEPPFALCFGVGSTSVGIHVAKASGSVNPSVELWLDAGTYACTLVTGSYCYSAHRVV